MPKTIHGWCVFTAFVVMPLVGIVGPFLLWNVRY